MNISSLSFLRIRWTFPFIVSIADERWSSKQFEIAVYWYTELCDTSSWCQLPQLIFAIHFNARVHWKVSSVCAYISCILIIISLCKHCLPLFLTNHKYHYMKFVYVFCNYWPLNMFLSQSKGPPGSEISFKIGFLNTRNMWCSEIHCHISQVCSKNMMFDRFVRRWV